MWSCAPCKTENEPHALFCSVCGAARFKLPLREPAGPIEPPPLPAPALPEFRGTVAGFTVAWTLATLGAALGAWLVEYCLSFLQRFTGNVDSWEVRLRMAAWGVAASFVFGTLVGAFQSWVLRRRVPRPGWSGWILATLGGTVLVSLAGHLLPRTFWMSGRFGGGHTGAALLGIIGGGLIGLLQSRVLSRVVGPGNWSAWWVVSAAALAAGNVAGGIAWEWVIRPEAYTLGNMFLAGLANTTAHVGLVALLSGIPLGRMLRRRCGLPPEPSDPQDADGSGGFPNRAAPK